MADFLPKFWGPIPWMIEAAVVLQLGRGACFELRKQRVAIDVSVPSAWAWLLGRVPFPTLIFLGIMLVGGLVRLVGDRRHQQGLPRPRMG